eukprot:TRINITY_DN50859_c0_g1_i1.p1 TRINITY_DN50859_c0_g1~~TRINITY_DN50859_c0_g1_i1.p1  ORF type:complete len:195 (-),score=31.17 TRINITY_DN50859_c0_g1_i1:52-606(-)
MATAAFWVASGWLPPAALAVARYPDFDKSLQTPIHTSRVHHAPASSLCQDTSGYVIQQLWPPSAAGEVVLPQASAQKLSPRTFESRLRHSATLLQDLQAVAAVSQNWAHRIDADGFPAAYAYLYQEQGTKCELRRRYADSMRELLVKDWIGRAHPSVWRPPDPGGAAAAGPEGLVARIVSFMLP